MDFLPTESKFYTIMNQPIYIQGIKESHVYNWIRHGWVFSCHKVSYWGFKHTNIPIFGKKRIFHHFSNQYPICEKFYHGHTLGNQVGISRLIDKNINIFEYSALTPKLVLKSKIKTVGMFICRLHINKTNATSKNQWYRICLIFKSDCITNFFSKFHAYFFSYPWCNRLFKLLGWVEIAMLRRKKERRNFCIYNRNTMR